MSNRDLPGDGGLPEEENDYLFSDLFGDLDPDEFEFEYSEATGDGTSEPGASPFSEPPVSPDAEEFPKEDDFFSELSDDTYLDSGAYRSYDGASEYRSFDAAMPDPEEGWYHYSDEDGGLDEEDFEDYGVAPEEEYEEEPAGKHRGLKIFGNIMLAFVTVLSVFYLMVLYSGIPYLTNLRDMYVRTAMSTINHKWLATAIVPSDIIDQLMLEQYRQDDDTVGVNTDPDWGSVSVVELPNFADTAGADQAEKPSENDAEAESKYGSREEQTFFELFHELDYDSMQSYLQKHPDALAYGWAYIDINEAGLDDKGTDIYTNQGDQVLAINAYEGVLLIRIEIDNSRGVLAICKDTSRLSLCAATTLPATGQTAGKICDNNSGILAITGSAFMDDGTSNGGQLSGLAICNGVSMGTRLGSSGDKRLELRNDDKMYIVDSADSVNSDTRDACEFRPALIVNGENVARLTSWGTSPNPRAVLGQSNRLETMMVVVEGRLADSLGCTVGGIADKLEEYGCVQAMNLDGGTSAIMYYEGEYITRCSNTATPSGRTLPSAWVYHKVS